MATKPAAAKPKPPAAKPEAKPKPEPKPEPKGSQQVRLLCGFTRYGRRGSVVAMPAADAKKYLDRGTVELIK